MIHSIEFVIVFILSFIFTGIIMWVIGSITDKDFGVGKDPLDYKSLFKIMGHFMVVSAIGLLVLWVIFFLMKYLVEVII